jgi:hypothetical protein
VHNDKKSMRVKYHDRKLLHSSVIKLSNYGNWDFLVSYKLQLLFGLLQVTVSQKLHKVEISCSLGGLGGCRIPEEMLELSQLEVNRR